jgi:hypothetical protein
VCVDACVCACECACACGLLWRGMTWGAGGGDQKTAQVVQQRTGGSRDGWATKLEVHHQTSGRHFKTLARAVDTSCQRLQTQPLRFFDRHAQTTFLASQPTCTQVRDTGVYTCSACV